MASREPPKFKPFTRTKVYLALEATPLPIDQHTDLTAFAGKPFRGADGKVTGASEATGEATEATEAPRMFGKKKRAEPAKRAPVAPNVSGMAFPGLLAKAPKKRAGPPAAPRVYARFNVMSRDLQAAQLGNLPGGLQGIAKGLLNIETGNPYKIEPAPEAFVPLSRTGFGSFLVNKYGPIFPKAAERALDVAKCAAKGEEGNKEVKIYHYQAFVREYLRYESPYRGLLVYHGLGSGKTCSAIAAAEALFGTRGLKIIVMTPFSLRDNFISEISFCGFKHFRLQNHWTSLSMTPGSDPDPAMVKLFAQNVYGIPDSYFAKRARGRAQLNKIWIPDFEQKPNFDSLKPEERDEIQTQLKATIENRIKFINYNGITARELKTMVCSTPDIFDNAVIVVDEVHNLTRLIQGSLEMYLGPRSARAGGTPREFLTPDRKKLPLCGMTQGYLRGYLFYRLFMDAKNTKVIGLSGTPLINFPEEMGILMNILHGPLHTIEFVATVEAMRDVRAEIEKTVLANENLDTVFFEASEGSMTVTVTRVPEQFTKILAEDGSVLGIERREPGKVAPTLDQLWLELQAALKAINVKVVGKGSTKASELLPSWDTPFRGAFLQEDGITLKNTRVLQKRIRGLVSYYRGIQGDVMPKVIKDEILGIPLTGYSLKIYNKLRNQEIQIEMSKPKAAAGAAGDAVWAEINEIATMKSPSNYRMSSRQACNFVFPEGIVRPRPRNLDELDAETGKDRDKIVDVDVEDRPAGRDDEDAASLPDVDEEAIKADDAAAAGKAKPAVILGTKEQTAAYRAAIKSAKEKLRLMGPTHLMLNGPAEHNLARYSPKFAAMLTKINQLPGSSLVYSQFLEMEGIGIFGICMEANGYVPIEIIDGGDGKLKFSDRTAASLLKGPKAGEKRYIEFTGTGSKEQRGTAVNVFNARLDKVSPAIQKVLQDGGWKDNLDGGLCRVFCITSAGAEGLSLKCVRGVHIMEPYWNTVRTQQVKGRAVRICSHMELPPDQQNVEIYTYCTTIPEEAMLAQAVDKTLERSDTYPAKDAADLGVPVPPPAGAIDAGQFFQVEAEVEAPVAPGAQASTTGPIRFYSKLPNEFRGFSNFAPSPVVIGGKRYPTVEHYFQAMKFPSDPAWQEAIRVAPTPAKAKQLGTQADKPVRADWDRVRETVMLEALRAKFQQNAGLLQQLKETGMRPLIEASPADPFWGEGRTGKGKNRMGKLLEQVREELREYVIPADVLARPQTPPKEEYFNLAVDEDESEPVAEPVAAPLPLAGPVAMAAPEPVADVDELTSAMGAVALDQQKGGDPDQDRIIILTSDQKVLLISLRKERVIGSLQTLMKTVAVDCQLNFADNNDGTFRCLALGNSVDDFAYNPDLQRDITETEAKFKVEAPVAAPIAPPVAAPISVMAPPVAAPVAPMPMAAPMAAPVAAPAAVEAVAMPVAAPVAVEPVKPKPKRVVYDKKQFYYKPELGPNGKPTKYILFAMTDPDNTVPVGYIAADPIKGLPTGPIMPAM
jgi:ribA/ribD-fused uncharacterized protein